MYKVLSQCNIAEAAFKRFTYNSIATGKLSYPTVHSGKNMHTLLTLTKIQYIRISLLNDYFLYDYLRKLSILYRNWLIFYRSLIINKIWEYSLEYNRLKLIILQMINFILCQGKFRKF